MTSIFDLKTSTDELSSANQGTSRMQFDEHAPTRDVTGTNFSNGAIHFKWENSGQKWFIPSKTYMRTRFNLTKANGTQLTVADGVAPNMDLMPNLFQSGEMRIQDKVVSRVADFMPQVDSLEARLSKSRSWLDSVGNSTNWWQASQGLRMAEVSSDGSIVKDEVPIFAAGAITSRGDVGFYDAAAALALSNFAAYVAATGVITFNQGAGGAALPDANVVWSPGDYFAFRGVATAGVNNVQMKVISVDSATQITVEAKLAANRAGAADPTEDFYKVAGVSSASNSDDSRRIAAFETVWQPPLSLFKIQHAMPAGRYELVLNPQTSTAWKKRAIESVLGSASKVSAVDYDISIVSMYLYVNSVDGPRSDDMTYLLDLEQTRCQAEKVDNASFSQKNADISPSTYAVTIAYQDVRAGEHTSLSASKFRSYNASVNPTAAESVELALNRQFINYAGQNLPQPDADPLFVAGTDYTVQQYIRTQLYSGSYFDTGGSETITEWHDRGAYYYYAIPRDGSDRSTRLNIHSGFAAGTVTTNLRVLIFDHSKQVAKVRVESGRVVDVQLEDA